MCRVSDALARIRGVRRAEWPQRIRKLRNKVARANASTKSPGAILDEALGLGPQG
jgi:hypothetical protein